MKQEICYNIYSPNGNDTALVQGVNFSNDQKKIINENIMKLNTEIEQVGFVEKGQEYKLIMAGGEFCGNATRSAAYYFLQGKSGQIKIKVSGIDKPIDAGIDNNQNTWCRFPIYLGEDVVTELETGIYKVKMNGIVHIVIDNIISQEYLSRKDNITLSAMELINKFEVYEADAIGVIFLEKINLRLKIHPVVWVKSIDTLFYETACGSGSVAVGILKSFEYNSGQKLEIIQPSDQIIYTDVSYIDGKLVDAIISGKINTDNILKKIVLEL